MALRALVGAVATGWIAGLGFGLIRPQFARSALLAIGIGNIAILAVFVMIGPQSQTWTWLGWTYPVLTGALAGVAGPALFEKDRLFAVGLSVICAPTVPFFFFLVAASVSCAMGACL